MNWGGDIENFENVDHTLSILRGWDSGKKIGRSGKGSEKRKGKELERCCGNRGIDGGFILGLGHRGWRGDFWIIFFMKKQKKNKKKGEKKKKKKTKKKKKKKKKKNRPKGGGFWFCFFLISFYYIQL